MRLLPGERELASIDGDCLKLTTHRVWYRSVSGHDKKLEVILLEDVKFCSVVHAERKIWLAMAIVVVTIGIIASMAAGETRGNVIGVSGGCMLAMMCWLRYRSSKEPVLRIASAGGAIVVTRQPGEFGSMARFCETLLAAKYERQALSRGMPEL